MTGHVTDVDDPYRVLEVIPEASDAVIQAAFRSHARRSHPDRGGDPEEFRRIRAAWAVLGDPARRRAWDLAHPSDHNGVSSPGPDGPAAESEVAGPPPLSVPWRDPGGTDLTVRPGGARRWTRLATWVVTVLWIAVGLWIPVGHVLAAERAAGPVAWAVGWALAWTAAGVVAALAVTRGRPSWSMIAMSLLAWPAWADAGRPWAWLVFAWLAWMFVGAAVHRRVGPRLVSLHRAADPAIVGVASWQARHTADLVGHLTVIPAVRIRHLGDARPADSDLPEHIVVCDRRVAVIGPAPHTPTRRGEVRHWPMTIADDPQRALDDLTQWLTTGNDGRTVDRAVLAEVGF